MTQLFSPKVAAVVAAMALCWGWPVYDGVAQVDGAADNAILTVGRCIGSEATIGSLEETLIKEGIIEKDLLQTEVTNVMCKDMLEPASDGAPLQKLSAAQNYVQEIKLIKGAMGEATDGAAVRGTDRYSSSDESLVMFQAIGQTTSEQIPAHAQYPDGTGGPSASASADGTGGDTTGVVEPKGRQAAAAANAGEDNADPISERLRQKAAAAKLTGASTLEAQAAARCGVEVDLVDAGLKRIEDLGLYKVTPYIPEEIRLRKPEEAGLLVQSTTTKEFREIKRGHEAVAGASESGVDCVILTDRMKAELIPLTDEETLKVDRGQGDDIQKLSDNRDTLWSWDIKGRQAGSPWLLLDLKYEISQEDQQFRRTPGPPVYERQIKVRSPAPEPPWWRRIFERISGFF